MPETFALEQTETATMAFIGMREDPVQTAASTPTWGHQLFQKLKIKM